MDYFISFYILLVCFYLLSFPSLQRNKKYKCIPERLPLLVSLQLPPIIEYIVRELAEAVV